MKTWIDKHIDKDRGIIIVVFDNEGARDEFIKRVPKSLRLKAGTLGEWNENGQKYSVNPTAQLNIQSTLNKVTGEFNEAGTKRWNRMIDEINID
jgi:hypothetical protein